MKHCRRILVCSFPCLLLASSFLSSDAQAEGYMGGQFGISQPSDFRHIEGSRAFSGMTVSDLSFKDASFLLGGKFGFFFDTPKWLGFETEIFHTSPHLKQQGFTVMGPGGSASGIIAGTSIAVTTWAFNILARYPGDTVQPYVGAGLGVFFPDVKGSIDTDNVVGLNALGGIRYFLTKQLAVFGEYKYDRATLKFTKDVAGFGTAGLEGDYVNNIFVVGLSLHFY